MNMALFDLDMLALAFVKATHDHDRTALNNYTSSCLPRIWKYQEFSIWMTDSMHDAGDPTLHGKFREQISRARLDTLFQSPAPARLHSDFQQGTI